MNPHELDDAIATLYSGPAEDFVARRHTLAKELRAAGDRDSANAVKGLRKPSRMAWALNLGVREDRSALDGLDAAIAGILDAQTAGGDVRAAMSALRGAVRELAIASADAAQRAGHRLEASVAANALLAVLGRPGSLEQLRTGQLADVPEAGGLDFLADLPAPAPAANQAETRAADARAVRIHEPGTRHQPGRSGADDAAAREKARRAAEALAAARNRAEPATARLRAVESELAAAETKVREAEADLAALRDRQESARRDADAAAADLRTAEADNAEAESY